MKFPVYKLVKMGVLYLMTTEEEKKQKIYKGYKTHPKLRGDEYERRIVRKIKAEVFEQGEYKGQPKWDVVVRSSGSRSEIDIIAISKKLKIVQMIQCKLNMPAEERDKISFKNKSYNGVYMGAFRCL
jgi:hypothetical protein